MYHSDVSDAVCERDYPIPLGNPARLHDHPKFGLVTVSTDLVPATVAFNSVGKE